MKTSKSRRCPFLVATLPLVAVIGICGCVESREDAKANGGKLAAVESQEPTADSADTKPTDQRTANTRRRPARAGQTHTAEEYPADTSSRLRGGRGPGITNQSRTDTGCRLRRG